MSDHNKLFDGIAQADNDMPKWYSISFVISMIIGLLYFGYYHLIDDFKQETQYQEEVALYDKEHPKKVQSLDASSGNPYNKDAKAIIEGEKIFTTTCAACHKADATGLVGPDLTDAVWLHGKTESEVHTVIMEGLMGEMILQNPPKGPMPAHKVSLGSDNAWKVVAWMKNKFKNIE